MTVPFALLSRLAICVAVLACATTALRAEEPRALRGVALVIGQSQYEHLDPLPNPANDADAIETLLSDLGFDSVRRTDRKAANLKRDLDRFAEDARDADVAVLYYSGHGIEAGGENFLIPVDADLSSLDRAGETLVPVSALIDLLRATVPVVIVMLDACRDNPFPPGSLLRLSASGESVAVGVSGLGLLRGAASLTASAQTGDASAENVGTVLAFAAEPGKAALDGDAGGNSPYAAALLRHFDAMAGEEFGTVMRMVAEEVYLKTGGRQRPWINESLRRLLYFGEQPAAPVGDEGDLLRERRQLLVTIAALPPFRRAQVESAAVRSSVPIDVVYGVLRALGHDAPSDPGAMEELLRSEAARISSMLAERAVITSPDAEIVRISALADTAEREGLLTKAGELRERAKARFLKLEQTLEQQQEALDKRFIEGAEVFARSAQTKALSADYLGAAFDFEQASRRVEGRVPDLAWRYSMARVVALTNHGWLKGDRATLEGALATGQETLTLVEGTDRRLQRAATYTNLGNAYQRLGELETRTMRLEEAVAAYQQALQIFNRQTEPGEWAQAQNNLGAALRLLGEREAGTTRFSEAVAAFDRALEKRPRASSPDAWAETQINRANALLSLGYRETGTDRLQQAVDTYRAALEEWTRADGEIGWATAQNNLGVALAWIGTRTADQETLNAAADTLTLALDVRTRDRAPLDWAGTMSNLALVYMGMGYPGNDVARFRQAADAYRAALLEFTAERAAPRWAATKTSLGNALRSIGEAGTGTIELEAAVSEYRQALTFLSSDTNVFDWALTQRNLGVTLGLIGERSGDREKLVEAVDALRASLTGHTRAASASAWAEGQKNLGIALVRLGLRDKSIAVLVEAVTAFENALQEIDREPLAGDWIVAQALRGYTLQQLSQMTEGEDATSYLERSVASKRALAEIYSRATQPEQWSVLQNDIGYHLVLIGERRGTLALFAEAEAVLTEALAVQRELKATTAPYVMDSLCRAKRNIGAFRKDRAVLLEAQALCEESLASLTAAKDPAAGVTAENLEQVRAALQAL